MKNNFGFDVTIQYKEDSPWGKVTKVRHNVTEIHYHYKSMGSDSKSVAFESDIHLTGGTIPSEYIDEFEAKLATKKHDNY